LNVHQRHADAIRCDALFGECKVDASAEREERARAEVGSPSSVQTA
jgi:hypothetical protein